MLILVKILAILITKEVNCKAYIKIIISKNTKENSEKKRVTWKNQPIGYMKLLVSQSCPTFLQPHGL